MPSETEVTIEKFRAHLESLPPARRIDEVVVHHTWRPTVAQYQGIRTVRAVRRYHMHVRGWSDNGYHVMVGPDGRIFLCRPIRRSGAHVAGRNAHTVGVCFIGDYDVSDPVEQPGYTHLCEVVSALLARYRLGLENIRFHREFAAKTCPGTKFSLRAFREDVRRGGRKIVPFRVVVEGHEMPDDTVELREGRTWIELRTLADAAGLELGWNPETQTVTVARRSSERPDLVKWQIFERPF